jgi:hypothetical protein
MFNSPIIDIALALSFTYFTLSLAVSTLHEYISGLMNKRGKQLETAITNLLFDPQWKSLSIKVYASSHINALKSGPGKQPSYIPASSFAQALMDQFKNGKTAVLDMNMIREVLLDDTKAAATGIEGDIREILLGVFERAQGDLQNFQKQVESFFNNAMDRVSGSYKRSTHIFIFVASLFIAVALNADTVHITKTLWENPATLKQTADNAQAVVRQISGGATEAQLGQAKFSISPASLTKSSTTFLDTASTAAAASNVAKQVTTTEVFLKQAGLPIGWDGQNYPAGGLSGSLLDWIVKFAGFILTAAALTLGAPFWFDLINKIVDIRAAGKKPEETPNTAGNTSNPATQAVG